MRFIFVSLAICVLTGCGAASFNLRDRELYVSPNGVHRVQLDKTIYAFKYELDEGLNKWRPPPYKSDFELPLGQNRSSVPERVNKTL